MTGSYGRATEFDVSVAVLRYLDRVQGGSAHIKRIRKALPSLLDLNDNDRAISDTRPNEEMWEQQVRNIVSHRTAVHNFIHDGLLAYAPQTLIITDAGRKYLANLAA